MHEQIDSWVDRKKEQIIAMYQFLHNNAEISWEEVETTKFIKNELEKLSIPYQLFDDQTGIVGVWGKENNPVIGLRADMDALWQQVKGEWKANHSCGHDAHTTILLFTLRCLKELGQEPKGRIKCLFQPAEETGAGAISFINKGLLDDVDYLLGLHVRPIQEMRFGECSPAIYHGAAASFKGKLYGMQSHAARPHLGINVIDSLTAINMAIRSIPLNPIIPASAKMTFAQAGGKNFNIIPDYAEFGIDVRAQTNEAMEQLISRLESQVKLAGEANGARVELELLSDMPAARPNKSMEEIVAKSIKEILGEKGLVKPPVTPGGEDFHYYAKVKEQLQTTMIGLGTDLQPGLHHPDMYFQLESLLHGIKIMALSTVKLMEEKQ
ncbi:amidohydrolase [Niallia circulans]|jgi:amidohydrolase|nr:M20 peptidase aminoacylase family protein [Niallia circulans]MCM2980636.1 M20 peptidase aminoacylase family protein [Niallia circulans]MED5102241.1 M20 peptidase aminoacylase family protein [Niallia circulans]NRG34295.1 M20 peptidase aminoacylase family protein [Niallia circulans]PAD26102.1 amidohydrolase [Niallia circulans]PAD86222.1 amidohydrolase [Niallia circulans]